MFKVIVYDIYLSNFHEICRVIGDTREVRLDYFKGWAPYTIIKNPNADNNMTRKQNSFFFALRTCIYYLLFISYLDISYIIKEYE